MQAIIKLHLAVTQHEVIEKAIHPQRDAAVSGKHHFAYRCEQATVGTIMVGEDQLILIQSLHDLEQRFQGFGIIYVRRLIAHLVVNLGKGGTTEATFVIAQIN